MKFYFILLAVLWLARMTVSVSSLLFGQHPLYMLNHALDLVALTLCLTGTLQLSFGKVLLPKFTPDHWRLLSRGTLLLGALSTLLYTHGDLVGVPATAGPGLMGVAMVFIPYLLFSIPIIVLEHDLRKKA